jgi:predicted ABC-type ATPase
MSIEAEAARKILILAGPNGAGKTTFAREFLPGDAECPTFVNADLIAAGLSPFAPETVALRAGRLMLEEIERHVTQRVSFAFETTLSGRGYARLIPQWRAQGYRVELFFLSLPNAEAAIARVAERVRQGGHDIPEATIRRRFDAGLTNLRQLYAPLVHSWALYDNAGELPVLIDWGENP